MGRSALLALLIRLTHSWATKPGKWGLLTAPLFGWSELSSLQRQVATTSWRRAAPAAGLRWLFGQVEVNLHGCTQQCRTLTYHMLQKGWEEHTGFSVPNIDIFVTLKYRVWIPHKLTPSCQKWHTLNDVWMAEAEKSSSDLPQMLQNGHLFPASTRSVLTSTYLPKCLSTWNCHFKKHCFGLLLQKSETSVGQYSITLY